MSNRGFAGFSPQELKVIELRTNGIKPPQIAKQLQVSRDWVYTLLWSAMRKAGVDDVCLLTRWAMKYGFDEPLREDLPEEVEEKRRKAHKGRIKLNRTRGTATKRQYRAVRGQWPDPLAEWQSDAILRLHRELQGDSRVVIAALAEGLRTGQIKWFRNQNGLTAERYAGILYRNWLLKLA